uniref:Uncharacterized protein n=1 Tax=Lygus hesperus TaxID=30085 RepID=A0A146LJE5_LYGHE
MYLSNLGCISPLSHCPCCICISPLFFSDALHYSTQNSTTTPPILLPFLLVYLLPPPCALHRSSRTFFASHLHHPSPTCSSLYPMSPTHFATTTRSCGSIVYCSTTLPTIA